MPAWRWEAHKPQEAQRVPRLMTPKVTKAMGKYWEIEVCLWWSCPRIEPGGEVCSYSELTPMFEWTFQQNIIFELPMFL